MSIIDSFDRMGGEIYYKHDKDRYMRDPELREAFEAGCEHGYHKAMNESGDYDERRMYDDRGRVIQYRDRGRGGMNYREEDYDDGYDERRRRSSRTGRYY